MGMCPLVVMAHERFPESLLFPVMQGLGEPTNDRQEKEIMSAPNGEQQPATNSPPATNPPPQNTPPPEPVQPRPQVAVTDPNVLNQLAAAVASIPEKVADAVKELIPQNAPQTQQPPAGGDNSAGAKSPAAPVTSPTPPAGTNTQPAKRRTVGEWFFGTEAKQ